MMSSKLDQKFHFVVTIGTLFKGIEWFIYLVFCIIAGTFMKDVLDQFHTKATFMGQSLEPITKLPTIVFCVNSKLSWNSMSSKGQVKVKYYTDVTNQVLKEYESMDFQETNETIFLQQYSGKCVQVKSEIKSIVKRGTNHNIRISFMNIKPMPKSVTAYFTSKENSYGVFNNEWYDGQVFEQTIQLGHRVKVNLKPVEYTYLNDDNQCSDLTFLDQWKLHLKNANFSECFQKCTKSPFLVSDDLSFCGWDSKSDSCPSKLIMKKYKEIRSEIGYQRPCNILEYMGQKTYDALRFEKKDGFEIRYQFTPPEMTLHFTERLVFDTIGMVGSIGGTLGMCIGFSFSGITSTVLEFIQSRINTKV